jgi:predicted Zn-dependent protease
MSHGVIAQAGLTVSNIGLAILGVDPALNQLAMAALGAGTQGLVLLPFSRKHESEADYVGVLLAGDAGYDPREAIHIWERMAGASEGAAPEFMSTHPSHETRISDLKGWMPEAMAIYERAPKASSALLPQITPSPSTQPR